MYHGKMNAYSFVFAKQFREVCPMNGTICLKGASLAVIFALMVVPAALVEAQERGDASLSAGEVAATGSAVTLKEAQALALEGNATLRAQRLTLEAARRSSQARWNSFLPGINLGGSVSNSHTIVDGSSGSGAGTPAAGGNANWSWGISGGVSLSLTAGIPVQMQLAALGYEIARTNYQLQLQTVMANVASSFYNLVAEAKNLSVLEDNLELTRSQYEQSRQNYNRGLASELDMLRSQYAYVSAQPELEKARLRVPARAQAGNRGARALPRASGRRTPQGPPARAAREQQRGREPGLRGMRREPDPQASPPALPEPPAPLPSREPQRCLRKCSPRGSPDASRSSSSPPRKAGCPCRSRQP